MLNEIDAIFTSTSAIFDRPLLLLQLEHEIFPAPNRRSRVVRGSEAKMLELAAIVGAPHIQDPARQ